MNIKKATARANLYKIEVRDFLNDETCRKHNKVELKQIETFAKVQARINREIKKWKTEIIKYDEKEVEKRFREKHKT